MILSLNAQLLWKIEIAGKWVSRLLVSWKEKVHFSAHLRTINYASLNQSYSQGSQNNCYQTTNGSLMTSTDPYSLSGCSPILFLGAIMIEWVGTLSFNERRLWVAWVSFNWSHWERKHIIFKRKPRVGLVFHVRVCSYWSTIECVLCAELQSETGSPNHWIQQA